MKKVFKDICEECQEWKEGCHEYEGRILCPECAEKLGYEKWQKKKGKEVTLMADTGTDEKFFENGTRSITVKKEENGIKVRFFENGTVVKEHTYNSSAGVYKAKKSWLGA